MNCCSTNILAPIQSLLCTNYVRPNQFSPILLDGWLAKGLHLAVTGGASCPSYSAHVLCYGPI